MRIMWSENPAETTSLFRSGENVPPIGRRVWTMRQCARLCALAEVAIKKDDRELRTGEICTGCCWTRLHFANRKTPLKVGLQLFAQSTCNEYQGRVSKEGPRASQNRLS